MSELKTNKISTNDQNNVAIDNALGLKSYTTTQRDALTSVAGDMIYNSTDSKVQVYTGSAWEDLGGVDAFNLEYLIIGGGGSGPSVFGGQMYGGGGGAGGYISNVSGENSGGGLSSHQKFYAVPSADYPVSIGGGGAALRTGSGQQSGFIGTGSYFNNISAAGGGAGQSYIQQFAKSNHASGGSGGGRGTYISVSGVAAEGGDAIIGQGNDGGASNGNYVNNNTRAAGGGGGAGGAGTDAGGTAGGNGGAGVSSSITGTATERAGGGGGAGSASSGSATGGGGAGQKQGTAADGSANTGGGGGGIGTTSATAYGGNGGSGVVILRYPSDYTITIGSGLTASTETTDGDDKYIEITAGTGTVSWS